MSDISKSGRSKPSDSPRRPEDPFELPRLIAQQLKRCVESRRKSAAHKSVQYLWINMAANRPFGRAAPSKLALDEWLNVLDEAASLGAGFLVICVGETIHAFPDLWKICRWAQDMHRMTVGLHVRADHMKPADFKPVESLDSEKTVVFFSGENGAAKRAMEKAGFRVCHAAVKHAQPAAGCDGPKNLLFVASDGMVYSCGVVLGNKTFKLGHVLEHPVGRLLNTTSVPRSVPIGHVRAEGGCDGCPNQMASRLGKI